MARRKREPMSEGKKNIIADLIEEYDIRTAKDIEDALRDLMGGTIQEMLEAELDEHLRYRSYERSDSSNYRNGKKTKKIRGNLEPVFTRNICGFSSIILLQARQKYAGGLSPGKYFSRRMQQNLPKRHLYTLVKTGSYYTTSSLFFYFPLSILKKCAIIILTISCIGGEWREISCVLQ